MAKHRAPTLAGLKVKYPWAPITRTYEQKLSEQFAPLQISEQSILKPFFRFLHAKQLVLTVSLHNTSLNFYWSLL